jgi:hypothetical protein
MTAKTKERDSVSWILVVSMPISSATLCLSPGASWIATGEFECRASEKFDRKYCLNLGSYPQAGLTLNLGLTRRQFSRPFMNQKVYVLAKLFPSESNLKVELTQ